MRSKGAWGTSLNKRLAAIWIGKSTVCNLNSPKTPEIKKKKSKNLRGSRTFSIGKEP